MARSFRSNDVAGEFITLVYTKDQEGRAGWALPGGGMARTFPLAMHAVTLLDADCRRALKRGRKCAA